jgi:hypothetical protein
MGLLFFTFGNNIALAQHIDSTKKNIVAVNHFSSEQQILQALQNRPYFNYTVGAKTVFNIKEKNTQGKEFYFYVLAGLLLLFAGLKTVLNKYFDDLIDLFFRRSPKQRQLKQQVSQNALPSLFFNIFYVLVAGFYLSLLVQGLGKMSSSFWQLSVYCMAAISITYIGKYLVLKFTGWIFQLQSLTDSYIFIVFFVNKIIGVVLLPIVIAIALGNIGLKTAVIMLSWIVLLLLLIYRCVQTFRLLREGKSISIFHFILYLLAFEILPVPIIYKAISQYLQF